MTKPFAFAQAAVIGAFVCAPLCGSAQTVTLAAPFNVAAAEDFATRSFQDPWDMNELTDFGWFLHAADLPHPDLTNVSFANGIFSATTGASPNVFLLETGNPEAARLGKTGFNHPIDANNYRFVAMRVYIDAYTNGAFYWNRDHLWDGTTSISGTFALTPGWRTYLVDLPTLGLLQGSTAWSGFIRSLQFSPSAQNAHNLQIDWIRLTTLNTSLCRVVTWSGIAGAVDVYLDSDSVNNGNETMLAPNTTSNTASLGCAPAGAGYNFFAGSIAPGSYQVLVRAAGSTGAFARSTSAYQVNAAPTLAVTAPSEEGSADDFATTRLGNPWDMNAVSDVETFFNVTSPTITMLPTENAGGVALGSTRVLYGTSTQAQAPLVGDPIAQIVWPPGTNLIDPTRYRILTVEYGIPNLARNMNLGSVARIAWRVAGNTQESVSDDIILNSRLGANVMDKFSVDMADRAVLKIEQGTQAGWVPGNSATPGIDRFRFDPHEFSPATPFYIRRVKLAALESVGSGSVYTIRWWASEGNGTATLYYDTDRNPSNGKTLIGSAATSTGQFNWTVPAIASSQYYIYAEINDNQGNSNAVYSRWPIVVGSGGVQPPSMPSGFQILR